MRIGGIVFLILFSWSLSLTFANDYDFGISHHRIKRNISNKANNVTQTIKDTANNQEKKDYPSKSMSSNETDKMGSCYQSETMKRKLLPSVIISEKIGSYDDRFDEPQKYWQSLEGPSHHTYEVLPWFRYDGGGSPYHSPLQERISEYPSEGPSHFHHNSYVGHFSPKRRNRRQKKSADKRKTVVIFHPLHKENDTKNHSPRIIRDDADELDEPYMENVFSKSHEMDFPHSRSYRYSDFAPWETPKIAFEEHYGVSKIKPMEPAESFLKLADMMINKIKTDSKIFDFAPVHTQVTTKITATPDLLISATTNSKHDGEKMHEMINPYDRSRIDEATAYGTLHFAPPLQIGNAPVAPKKVINLIENAIDSMVVEHDGKEDDEIEVHCPVHRAKVDLIAGSSDANSTQSRNNEMYEVCQCHFIKKKKDKAHEKQILS